MHIKNKDTKQKKVKGGPIATYVERTPGISSDAVLTAIGYH